MGLMDKMSGFFGSDKPKKTEQVDYTHQNVDFGAEVKQRADALDSKGQEVQDLANRVLSQEAADVGLARSPEEVDRARAQDAAPEKAA